MKNMFILLMSYFLISCTSSEEKFVNPLFYKTMEPISKMTWQTRLTPTEMHTDNGHGYSMTEKCKLLENTENKIIMHCVGYTPVNEKFELIYGFELQYPIENNKLEVIMTHWNPEEEEYVGYSYLYIDTSKD